MDSHRKLVLLLIKSYQINSEISEHTSETGVLASRIKQHNPWFYCLLFRYFFSHNICISSNKNETKCIFFLFFMTTNMLSNKLKQGFPFIILPFYHFYTKNIANANQNQVRFLSECIYYTHKFSIKLMPHTERIW